jgi:hypothetical protein
MNKKESYDIMLRKIINLMFISLIISCSSPNKGEIDYKPFKMMVDSTFYSRDLELIESLEIEENENLILNEIYSLTINHELEQLVVCDPTNRTINLYDYKTGRIIGFRKAGIFLSDSLANSGRKYPRLKWRNYEKFEFVKLADYEKKGIDKSELRRLQNSFYIPIISDNKLYVLTLLYCQTISESNKKVITNRSSIIIFNTNLRIEKVIVTDSKSDLYPVPYTFNIDEKNKNFYVSATDFGNVQMYHKMDSLPLITKTDYNGDLKDGIFYLKDKYEKSQAGYKIPWLPKIVEIQNELYITQACDLSIYGFDNKKKFDLYNLPFNNDTGFVLYTDLKYYLDSPKLGLEQKRKNLIKLFPVHIVNSFSALGNLILQILIYDESVENGYYYILQEYSVDGKLISQTNVDDDTENRIKYMYYDDVNNYLLFFRKGKEKWTLERRGWM